eukprot:scaffold4488_cov117-Isochrysis_galbana.AAC.4
MTQKTVVWRAFSGRAERRWRAACPPARAASGNALRSRRTASRPNWRGPRRAWPTRTAGAAHEAAVPDGQLPAQAFACGPDGAGGHQPAHHPDHDGHLGNGGG